MIKLLPEGGSKVEQVKNRMVAGNENRGEKVSSEGQRNVGMW